MDPAMQVPFGKMPISQIPNVLAAVKQKNNNGTILFMGVLNLVGGYLAYKIYE